MRNCAGQAHVPNRGDASNTEESLERFLPQGAGNCQTARR